jgi:hypothetical protein
LECRSLDAILDRLFFETGFLLHSQNPKRRRRFALPAHSMLAAFGLICFALMPLACTTKTEGPAVYPKAVGAADEGSAIQALRTIASAQTQAKAMRNSYASFDTLVQLGFLDTRFAGETPNLRGYRFSMAANESQFAVNADPQVTENSPTTGSRHFYLDSSANAIHVNPTEPATKQDPLL